MDTISPFLFRQKALSSLDSTSGGALVRPAAQWSAKSPFRNRTATKAMSPQPEDDVKAQLIAEILSGVFGGSDGKALDYDAKAKPAGPKRAEGETWEGAKNRWFTVKDGKTVPTKAPAKGNGGSSGTAPEPTDAKPNVKKPGVTPKKPATPLKPVKLTLEQVRKTVAELKKRGPTEDTLNMLVGSLATLTVADLKNLHTEMGIKPKGLKAELIAKIKDTLAAVKDADAPEAEPTPAPVSAAPEPTNAANYSYTPDPELDSMDWSNHAITQKVIASAVAGTLDPAIARKLLTGGGKYNDTGAWAYIRSNVNNTLRTTETDAAMEELLRNVVDRSQRKVTPKEKPAIPTTWDASTVTDYVREAVEYADSLPPDEEVYRLNRLAILNINKADEILATNKITENNVIEVLGKMKEANYAQDAAGIRKNDAFMSAFYRSKPLPVPASTNKVPVIPRLLGLVKRMTEEHFPAAAWDNGTAFVNALCGSSMDDIKLVRTTDGRAFFDAADGIGLDRYSQANSVVHECGHLLESKLSETGVAKLKGFISSRFSDESKDVDMGAYNKDMKGEIGNTDDMEKLFGKGSAAAAYVGKMYKDGSTEILSMGVELMYKYGEKFARTDPEYFALVLSLIDDASRDRSKDPPKPDGNPWWRIW